MMDAIVVMVAQVQAGEVAFDINKALSLTRTARSMGLQGKFKDGHDLLDQAERLTPPDGLRGKVAIALERGRLVNTGGDPAGSVPHFLKAWTLAETGGEPLLDLAVDALHMLAIVEPVDKAEDWTKQALALAATSKNPMVSGWKGPLLNNIGWSNFDVGRYERALTIFAEDAAYRDEINRPREARIARYGIARTLRALGRIDEALTLDLQLVKDAADMGDEPSFVFEELAELYDAKGDKTQSAAYAAKALNRLRSDSFFVKDEPVRLKRLEVLAGS
ncbi:tol-pal system YbgF family protein [Lacibacterium aquatile]|uniref:Tol-pal system YbgF family protein n=1 Tax=Lacibacterium aquatile TaxID=1168082 RepID=A0ABW5DMX7_9PROT